MPLLLGAVMLPSLLVGGFGDSDTVPTPFFGRLCAWARKSHTRYASQIAPTAPTAPPRKPTIVFLTSTDTLPSVVRYRAESNAGKSASVKAPHRVSITTLSPYGQGVRSNPSNPEQDNRNDDGKRQRHFDTAFVVPAIKPILTATPVPCRRRFYTVVSGHHLRRIGLQPFSPPSQVTEIGMPALLRRQRLVCPLPIPAPVHARPASHRQRSHGLNLPAVRHPAMILAPCASCA